MAYTREQLLEIYQKLPKEIQDAIFSVDTAEVIREIGEKNKLMIDKIGNLADETGLVMLGLTAPSQYIPHLTDRLEINRETARIIAEEINSKVFFPIRESLKRIHGLENQITDVENEPSNISKDFPQNEIKKIILPEKTLEEKKDIFETKTQEITHSPIEIKKIDPYREPTI